MQKKEYIRLGIGTLLILLLYFISQYFYFRIDLTNDSRYSLSENTKSLLKNTTKNYTIEIYLNGDLPYGFHKLRQATLEMIDEFNRDSQKRFLIEKKEVDRFDTQTIDNLLKRDVKYTSINIKDKNGKLTQQLIFPYLIIHNNKKEIAVNLLQNNPNLSGQENLNNSIANIEYQLTYALRMLERQEIPKIAFLEGHGELNAGETIDFAKSLSESYEVQRIQSSEIDTTFNVIIIAQPRIDFPETDKFAIDQYIMKGGKVLWLIDEVAVSKDSLQTKQETMAFYKPVNLEDQLFIYGTRINPDLVLDINADLVKVNTALKGEPARFSPMPWAYEPLLETNPEHPITKGLAPVRAIFANSIDIIALDNIKSTPLLRSSSTSRLEKVPRIITMKNISEMQSPSYFPHKNVNVAILLEGQFTSAFKGRLAYTQKAEYQEKSSPNKMIVIADGDIIKNETRGVGDEMQFLPLGYNPDYKYLHSNKIFLLNAIDYLVDDDNWYTLRNKEYNTPMLNKAKVRTERSFWQWFNLLIPLGIILLIGGGYNYIRRTKYRKRKS